MADASGAHDRGANVVDQLFADQLRAIVNRIEDLTNGERRGGVLPNQSEARLLFRRCRILEPEQMIWLEALAEPSGFNRRQPVVDVVQQVDVVSEFLA